MSESMSNVERGLWRIAELGARCSQQSAAGSRGPLWEELEKIISGLVRVSKPGRRVYVTHDKVPSILAGMGVAIVSTSRGVCTDRDARKQKVGGEVLAYVW